MSSQIRKMDKFRYHVGDTVLVKKTGGKWFIATYEYVSGAHKWVQSESEKDIVIPVSSTDLWAYLPDNDPAD